MSILQQSADLNVANARALRVPGDASLSVQSQRASSVKIGATGFQGNIGGGVLTRLSPRVNLDVGVTLGLIRFGDATVTVDGRSQGKFPGTSGTGQNVLFRTGLAIGLGKGTAAGPARKPVAKPAATPAPRVRRP